MKSYLAVLTILALLGTSGMPSRAVAADSFAVNTKVSPVGLSIDYGYTVTPGTNRIVSQFGTCRIVTNNSASAKALYISIKTAAEWASFVAHPPAAVTLANCQNCAVNYPSPNFIAQTVVTATEYCVAESTWNWNTWVELASGPDCMGLNWWERNYPLYFFASYSYSTQMVPAPSPFTFPAAYDAMTVTVDGAGGGGGGSVGYVAGQDYWDIQCGTFGSCWTYYTDNNGYPGGGGGGDSFGSLLTTQGGAGGCGWGGGGYCVGGSGSDTSFTAVAPIWAQNTAATFVNGGTGSGGGGGCVTVPYGHYGGGFTGCGTSGQYGSRGQVIYHTDDADLYGSSPAGGTAISISFGSPGGGGGGGNGVNASGGGGAYGGAAVNYMTDAAGVATLNSMLSAYGTQAGGNISGSCSVAP